jgi:hypothetical protein
MDFSQKLGIPETSLKMRVSGTDKRLRSGIFDSGFTVNGTNNLKSMMDGLSSSGYE